MSDETHIVVGLKSAKFDRGVPSGRLAVKQAYVPDRRLLVLGSYRITDGLPDNLLEPAQPIKTAPNA